MEWLANPFLWGVLLGFTGLVYALLIVFKVKVIYLSSEEYRNAFLYIADKLKTHDKEWLLTQIHIIRRDLNDYPTVTRRRPL